MRQYIRHPSNIPINCKVSDTDKTHTNRLIDVSLGGLCFMADSPFGCGTNIHINIPLGFSMEESASEGVADEFDGEGTVAWCRKDGGRYSIGVQFPDSKTQFGVRMVEQVCHIEHYRYDVLQIEGRSLTTDEAAKEWVDRFASEFPHV